MGGHAGARVCAKPGQAGQELRGSQITETWGMKARCDKLPRDLIKFGVREHEQRKKYPIVVFPGCYLTFMLNVVSSHKHRFMGTNLTQMSPGACGLLELQLKCLTQAGLTQAREFI